MPYFAKQGYRPDIDGLRAVAVISVILFHINKTILPGGFVGVDIFFVISGYLITLHIIVDIEVGRFSLIEFYKRRVKRIFPAMLVVVTVVLLASLVILRPEDTEKVAQSGIASLLSVANIYFWLFQDTSYFSSANNELPLLHLWSLGVEEQFYLFWPLLLVAVHKLIKGVPLIVLFTIATIISFYLGETSFERFPSFVYYMLPTRLGELLIGAIAAYIVAKGSKAIPNYIVHILALLGTLLISIALVTLSEDMVYPGFRATIPTIGTALLILAGHFGNSPLTQILKFRPLVLIGLISYSAYLWHWPLLAFIRYSGLDLHFLNSLLVFILTMLLAWKTYQYIEQPARAYRGTALKTFSYMLVIPVGILGSFFALVMLSDGYLLHWNAAYFKENQYKEAHQKTLPAYKFDYVCQKYKIKDKDLNSNKCTLGNNPTATNISPSVLLWGDSNAAHYIGIMGVFAQVGGYQFRNIAHSACPPINADPKEFVSIERLKNCRSSLDVMTSNLEKFDVYIISAAWDAYLAKSGNFLDIFYQTASDLASKGKLVILLGKIPPIKGYDRLCKEKSIGLYFKNCTHSAPLSNNIKTINAQLEKFTSLTDNIEYYDITKHLCSKGLCSAFDKDGHSMYYDSNHLALPASWKIGSDIVKHNKGLPFPFILIPSWPDLNVSAE